MEKCQVSQKLDQIIESNMKAHFIMIQQEIIFTPCTMQEPEVDPEKKVECNKHTFDQNELGLNNRKAAGSEAGLAPQLWQCVARNSA